MRKRRRWVVARLALLPLLALALAPQGARADAALDSLVASERAFSAMSVAQGMRTAFLTYLADDAVVFNPTPTNGKKAWESRPASPSQLIWEPRFAQVSSAGDLGYSTGPWELRPPADSTGVAAQVDRYLYGEFDSVWRKQRGVWRVVVDLGGSHARPESGRVGKLDFEAGPGLPRRTMKTDRTDLRKVDRSLSAAMRSLGAAAALAANSATDLRLNIGGQFPAVGIDAARVRADSLGGFLEYRPEGEGIANSGDLGYTYGLAAHYLSAKDAPVDTTVYLHVWRQEDGRTWKLALAAWNPLVTR